MTTTLFDAADYIDDEDDVIGFLEAAMEGADPDHIARALSAVARSKGMDSVTARTGVTTDRLLAMLAGQETPTMTRLYEIFDALGLAIRLERKAA